MPDREEYVDGAEYLLKHEEDTHIEGQVSSQYSYMDENKHCRSLTPGRAWTTPLPTSRQTSLPSSSPPTGHLEDLDLPGHLVSCRPQNKQSSSSS